MATHRLIIDPPSSGAWNMAVDEALLIDAAENGVATLRFYQWSEPTLSLGYFQHYEDRSRHAASRECAVVRRQTGGGAILHDRELTYSLAVPARHPLARQTETLYAAVHKCFIAVLRPFISTGPARWSLMRREQESTAAASDQPFLCFRRQARGDVLLVTEASAESWKILGSAQRRHRGALLQHGGLLLRRSPAAPELPGLHELTGLDVAMRELAVAVSVRVAAALNTPLVESAFPSELQSKAAELANKKYGQQSWTIRR